MQKSKINNSIFIDLIEGFILDQKKIRIQNKEELIKYSYHVAGTVGLMMSKIIGVKHKKAARSAIDLGIGMQLTNIARDVYEDSKMKRIYLPANWIPDISLKNLTDLHNKSAEKDERISNAIHEVISLSDKFYKTREERIKLLGENQAKQVEKRIFLQSIDINWKSHIQYLEQLRQVIGLRSYGQRDPLIEYKKEAFSLFENLLKKLKIIYEDTNVNAPIEIIPIN